MERGEDRSPSDFRQRLHGERQMPGGLAARGVDETQIRAVGQKADWNFRFPQQPLEASVGRCLPASIVCGKRVLMRPGIASA